LIDQVPLFHGTDVNSVMRNRVHGAQGRVDAISVEQFAASSDDQIVEHVAAEEHLEPLMLHEGQTEMTQDEFTAGGTPTLRVTVTIPFTGNESLWQVTPSPFYTTCPQGHLRRRNQNSIGAIVIEIERPARAAPAEFKAHLDAQLELIRQSIAWQTENIRSNDQLLSGAIRTAILVRRERLEKQKSVRTFLNIPLAKRPGAPDVEPLPVPRRLVRPLPTAPSAPPELGIADEVYEHILSVIRHEGLSFETTPATFAKHDEEELRDIILAHLNGHYQGDAAGERFRKKGKTDICIEAENRAAFVAECKVWRGPKECSEAADQLLSYLTWRDCKCALVFFNTKNAGFAAAQEALGSTLRAHPRFVSDAGGTKPGEWRFRFRQPGDDQRIVMVHVFLFDLFVQTKAEAQSSRARRAKAGGENE
jgi:hypothetical protein